MTNAMMLSDENPADVLKQNKKKTPDFRPGNFHVYAKSAALFIYLQDEKCRDLFYSFIKMSV